MAKSDNSKGESLRFDPGLEALMHESGVSYRGLAEQDRASRRGI